MQNAQIKRRHLLEYAEVFGIEPVNMSAWLDKLPSVSALEQLSYLLFLIAHPVQKLTQADHLTSWMMKMDNPDQRQVLQYVMEHSPFCEEGFELLDKEACLELIQLILINNNYETAMPNGLQYALLLKCLLVCNTSVNARQKAIYNAGVSDDIDTAIDKWMPVRMTRIDFERLLNFQIAFIKINYFFQFCLQDAKYSKYLEVFLPHYHVANYPEYLYNIIYPFLLSWTDEKPSSKLRLHPGNDTTMDFLNRLAINDHLVTMDEDYRVIRKYPLYKSDPLTYNFLYANFFLEKLFRGLLFDFSEVVKNNGFPNFDFAQLKSDMGNRFSEHHLFYSIMKRCFENYAHTSLTGTEIKGVFGQGEADYYLRKANFIFLFEFKDVTLPSTVKFSRNAQTIKDALVERLEETVSGQPKAIMQLIHSAADCWSGKYVDQGLDEVAGADCIIFPVIVHTDLALETQGINYWLKERCKQRLNHRYSELGNVQELVLIHLDTLIHFQKYFKDGTIMLENVIHEYLEYLSTDSTLNKLTSFDEFLKSYVVMKKLGVPFKIEQFDQIIESFTNSKKY